MATPAASNSETSRPSGPLEPNDSDPTRKSLAPPNKRDESDSDCTEFSSSESDTNSGIDHTDSECVNDPADDLVAESWSDGEPDSDSGAESYDDAEFCGTRPSGGHTCG